MKFRETFMYRSLEFPQLWVDSTNLYCAILVFPFAFLVFVFLVVAAVLIDFCFSLYNIFQVD